MDIRMAKRIINEKVTYKRKGSDKKTAYYLNACILRRNKETGKWYYQAELKELNANCVIVTLLEDVEELEVNNDGSL